MKTNQSKFLLFSIAILTLLLFVFFVIQFYLNSVILGIYFKIIIWFVLALLLSIAITYGYTLTSTAISEAIATLRRLSRVENLSHPLLLKLSSRAPGTYHHSLNVSNLGHAASKAIGCDSLLVRSAAYYHDIGKLKEPKIFIENQKIDEIPHDENSDLIRKNAKKIISHVDDGIKIAKEAELPHEIIDIIAEHHGNSRALYFFEKAKEKGLKIKKTDFSYKGPIPQSKESAIIMLSDCIEATAKASKNLDLSGIESIVSECIEEKLSEGQLRQANFTEQDLLKIKESFIQTLNSIYHQRISYKNQDEN